MKQLLIALLALGAVATLPGCASDSRKSDRDYARELAAEERGRREAEEEARRREELRRAQGPLGLGTVRAPATPGVGLPESPLR